MRHGEEVKILFSLAFGEWRRLACAALALTAAAMTLCAADSPEPTGEKIVFLKLRREAGAVKLLEVNIRPGRLKPQPARGPLEFEVLDASGAAVQSGALKDPSLERLEYEDPANPGHLTVREIRRENPEFTLRIPYHGAARKVRFFLKQTPAPGKLAAAAERIALGEITLPPEVSQ
jgi:hypothetical protein